MMLRDQKIKGKTVTVCPKCGSPMKKRMKGREIKFRCNGCGHREKI